MVALYHRVMRRENFEKAAKNLFELLQSAQAHSPNIDRALYVDIDGHRNSAGGYDHDMLELQQEFGIGFLSKFFKEVHFPLIDFENPKTQCNNIPKKLEIFSPDSRKNNDLNDLYIENYSNTEFVSEPDVHEYLQKVHAFLLAYRDYDFECMLGEDKQDFSNTHVRLWKKHISELINELYNSFVYGNLLTVAAMTRTLIECFVYYSILCKSGNEHLIHHWYICNLCCTRNLDDKLHKTIQQYCLLNHLDFNEMWKIHANDPRPTRWIRQIIPKGNLNFEVYCNYLEDMQIHQDYQSACDFVHGNGIVSKMTPFTFYVSICYRFNMMMLYIFRTIRLFPLNKSLEKELSSLEDELITLLEKYYS